MATYEELNTRPAGVNAISDFLREFTDLVIKKNESNSLERDSRYGRKVKPRISYFRGSEAKPTMLRKEEVIDRYLAEFVYTDVSSGSSDSISLDLNDPDRNWIQRWFPRQGDKIKVWLRDDGWSWDKLDTYELGQYTVDDFSFTGGPLSCQIEALAIPSQSGFKATKRTKIYGESGTRNATTLKDVAQTIADRAGLTLDFQAANFPLEVVTQDDETDCNFINDLMVRFGYAVKLFKNRLVIFDELANESRKSVAILYENDFEPGWKWNTSVNGTYTRVLYEYTHTEKDKTFRVDIGSGSRVLHVNTAAENQTEAQRIATAAIDEANKRTTTMTVTLVPHIDLDKTGTRKSRYKEAALKKLVAGQCVDIVGLGKIDGKYYIEQVEISITGSGTKPTLSLRKVEQRFRDQSGQISSTAEEAAAKEVVIVVGDRVRVKPDSRDYDDNSRLGSYIFVNTYTVLKIGKGSKADRVSIGYEADGEQYELAAVHAADLYVVEEDE